MIIEILLKIFNKEQKVLFIKVVVQIVSVNEKEKEVDIRDEKMINL